MFVKLLVVYGVASHFAIKGESFSQFTDFTVTKTGYCYFIVPEDTVKYYLEVQKRKRILNSNIKRQALKAFVYDKCKSTDIEIWLRVQSCQDELCKCATGTDDLGFTWGSRTNRDVEVNSCAVNEKNYLSLSFPHGSCLNVAIYGSAQSAKLSLHMRSSKDNTVDFSLILRSNQRQAEEEDGNINKWTLIQMPFCIRIPIKLYLGEG